MKRLAMATFLLLAVAAVRVDAKSLPQAKSAIAQETPSHTTPYVRGPKAKTPEPVRDSGRKTHRDLHLTHAVRGN